MDNTAKAWKNTEAKAGLGKEASYLKNEFMVFDIIVVAVFLFDALAIAHN